MQGKEKALQSQNITRQSNSQGKDSNKLERLKKYVEQSEYIDVLEQRAVCESFGLSYRVSVFREVYRARFYNYLQTDTTTVATVSKATKIPHKYLCNVKAYYESKGLLKVVTKDRCPSTYTSNVQFVSTNPSNWNGFVVPSNQLKLF